MGFWKNVFGKKRPEVDAEGEEQDGLLHKGQETHVDGFGDKSIDFFGGYALNMNNITGPAMVAIPLIYQEAGWFTPTLSFLFVMVISTISSTLLCEAMKIVPDEHKKERIELTTLAKIYFKRWAYIVTHILLFISLTAQNVASIVESAQTMDSTMITAFKWAGALEVAPHPGTKVIHEAISDSDSPFGSAYVISLGFIIVLCITIPLGYFNLDDNVHVQKAAVICLFFIVTEWFVAFGVTGLEMGRLKAFKSNQSKVLGTVIFNYAFVTSIPSWLNEKRAGVSINRTLWSATTISTILFIAIGVVGSMAYEFKGDGDLLSKFRKDNFPGALHTISEICVCAYPLVVFLTSIPVFSIIIRYNLMESKICGKFWANMWGVIFPWVLSLIFYSGSIINDVINWTSLLVNGVINFIIPLLLYILAKRHSRLIAAGKIQEEKFGFSDDETSPRESEDDEDSFVAIPPHWDLNPERVALVLVIVFALLLVVVIISDIVLAALGNQVF